MGAGRQRLPEAGQEVGGGGPAVLRTIGQGGQLPGRNVSGLCQPLGPGVGGQAAVPAGELDLGPRPVRGGRGAGWETRLPVEDGVGLGDGGASFGARPSESRMGCRGRRLRYVAVLSGGPGGLGDAVGAGCSGRNHGVAFGACLEQSGIPGIWAPPQAKAGGRATPHPVRAQR